MIQISYKGLTPKGYGKIRSIKTIASKSAAVALRKHFYPTRTAIVKFAPSPASEAVELSRGRYSGGIVGDPGSGRFLKTGGQRSVQAALTEERPVIAGGGTLISLTWGNIPVINSKIGFSWMTSNGHVRRTNTSQPLWGSLIQAWEGMVGPGGGSERIISRGGYPLRPEDKTFVPYVDKDIPSYHMVRRGYNSTRIAYQASVRNDIKAAVRRVGIA